MEQRQTKTREVATHHPSGPVKHTPAAAGVWFYVRWPQMKTGETNPPEMTRSDAKPYEPHTRYRGCVGLYKVIASTTRQTNPSPPLEIITPGKREPQTRPAQEHPPDETREREHTTQDRRDPRRATHPPKRVCSNFKKPRTNPTPAEAGVVIFEPAPTPNQTLSPDPKLTQTAKRKCVTPGDGRIYHSRGLH
ncbi:hypothetical protein BS47DRAFT_1336547, partial [Hydnum rufescens UP504]